jgi:hypothetical protein
MYGELLDQAGTHLVTATLALAEQALTCEAAARDAVTAHGRLLAALRAHTATLLGGYPERIAGIRRSAHPDPRDLAAIQLLDALHESAPPESPLSAAPRTEPAISWTAAARALGAASDLLATQRDSHGRWRSPQAWLLDEPDVRAAGLREIASVALVVAGAVDDPNFLSGERGTHAAELAHAVERIGACRAGAFGEAVPLDEGDAQECFDASQQIWRDGCGTADDES